jgi:hypothetical protein
MASLPLYLSPLEHGASPEPPPGPSGPSGPSLVRQSSSVRWEFLVPMSFVCALKQKETTTGLTRDSATHVPPEIPTE